MARPKDRPSQGAPPHRVATDEDGVVRLSVNPEPPRQLVTGRVALDVGGEEIEVEMTVPAGPVTLQEMTPVLNGLSSLFATRAAERIEAEGKAISCRAGCGACCRQLVPLAPSEARALAALVEAMPEQRRAEIRARFAAALEAVDPMRLMERLREEPGDTVRLGRAYFNAGVPCPFLEDESCSIHEDRPMSCREFLVTSPPALCAELSTEIERVSLEARPSVALLDAEAGEGWLPLIYALRFAANEPPVPDRTAAEILKDFVSRF